MKTRARSTILLSLAFLFTLTAVGLAGAGEWKNPKAAIGDPAIARLNHGKTELTPEEKEDIARYGYTGLELMTYVECNREAGQDNDRFDRFIQVSARGQINIKLWAWKEKYYYRDHRARLIYDGIHPGDIRKKYVVIYFSPADKWGMGVTVHRNLTAPEAPKYEDVWTWAPDLRKVRRVPIGSEKDSFNGTEMTRDDFLWYEPWRETHRIIGEDTIEGRRCLVVESHNRNPNYYLGKRVTWVELENFIDLHEEQFDRDGKLWKVIGRQWQQVPSGNYWARTEGNFYNLRTGSRTILQQYGWVFDQGVADEGFFMPREMQKQYHWRHPQRGTIPPIQRLEDLPPQPQVRWSFWEKLGPRPALARR